MTDEELERLLDSVLQANMNAKAAAVVGIGMILLAVLSSIVVLVLIVKALVG